MYRPNRLQPPLPAWTTPRQSITISGPIIKATVPVQIPLAGQGEPFTGSEQVVPLQRSATAVYPTRTEASLKVRHRDGQDIIFIKPDARSETLPLTWSAVNGSELNHKPVTTSTLKKYMQARGYPTAEVDMDTLAHKLAEKKGIRFRRHGCNPNVWFATSLRPPANQPKPKARPWYSIW